MTQQRANGGALPFLKKNNMAKIKINANKNTWIQSSQGNSVRYPTEGGQGENLLIGGWSDIIMTMISFDISSQPGNVKSAKVYLYLAAKYLNSIKWSRIEADWSESTATYNNRPTGATNNTGTSASQPDVNNWAEIDITTLYNQWKDGTYSNYGICLNGGQSSYSNIYHRYHARGYETESLRPYLEIEYDDNSKFFQLF